MTHIAGSNRGLATRFIWSFPGRSRNFRQQGFDEFAVAFPDPGRDLVALSDAQEELAKADERKSRVVDLRFFGGLSVEETAEVLDVSMDTVMLD
jgi:DNA-directed RNA polymerase specialized sigma24 family protein